MFTTSTHGAPLPQNSFDVEAMLFDMSNHISRAQPKRQMSNASSSCSSYRSRPSRITKPPSASNSPQNVQRRRATTCYKAPRHWSEIYQDGNQTVSPEYSTTQAGYSQAFFSSMASRPFSWHPPSVSGQVFQVSACGTLQRRPLAYYQSAAFGDISTPLTPPDSCHEAAGNNLLETENGQAMQYQANGLYQPVNHAEGLHVETSFQSTGLCFDNNPDYAISSLGASKDYVSSSATYSNQAWTDSLSTISASTAPQTPEGPSTYQEQQMGSGPTVASSVAWDSVDNDEMLPLARTDSKELIGMGLYDAPERGDEFAEPNIMNGYSSLLLNSSRESRGKGLKLEETWEPPPEEEEEEEEEEDEDEDEEEEGNECAMEDQEDSNCATGKDDGRESGITRILPMGICQGA